MLPTARRLVDLADAMTEDAERARLRPLRVAVPDSCPPHRLAALVAAGRRQRIHLEVRPADPAGRERLCRTLTVSAGIVAVPDETAVWRIPLGLASRTSFPAQTVFLETLRAGRTGAQARRRILVQPEDDVAHLRDPLTRAGQSVGLAPTQVAVTPSLVDAAAQALSSPDLLLCSFSRPRTSGCTGAPWLNPSSDAATTSPPARARTSNSCALSSTRRSPAAWAPTAASGNPPGAGYRTDRRQGSRDERLRRAARGARTARGGGAARSLPGSQSRHGGRDRPRRGRPLSGGVAGEGAAGARCAGTGGARRARPGDGGRHRARPDHHGHHRTEPISPPRPDRPGRPALPEHRHQRRGRRRRPVRSHPTCRGRRRAAATAHRRHRRTAPDQRPHRHSGGTAPTG